MLATYFPHPISIAEEEANRLLKTSKIVVILKGICCKEEVVEAYEEGMISTSWPEEHHLHVLLVIKQLVRWQCFDSESEIVVYYLLRESRTCVSYEVEG